MIHRRLAAVAALSSVLLTPLAASGPARADEEAPFITFVSTTSTENSGLLAAILPKFTARTGIEVRVVAVGTGRALRTARNGDADVLLVHHTPSEEAFVSEGFGIARHDVMYNDFVVVGPASDPAVIRGEADVARALRRIAESRATFLSRGDDSGTHKKEVALWQAAGVTPTDRSGRWYLETGSGQGATLNVASGMAAYALTDRGTWLAFENRGPLEILVEGDPRLFNQYGVIVIDPRRHPHVKAQAAQALVDWLLSPEGQAAIGAYRIGGEPAFFPNARPAFAPSREGRTQTSARRRARAHEGEPPSRGSGVVRLSFIRARRWT